MIKERIKAFKRELILQKVSELIEERGLEGLKMVDIAAACDISVGALYKLFGSKDELFYAYMEYQIDLFYRTLKSIFAGVEDPLDRIRIYIELKFETLQSKKQLLKDTIATDPLFFAKFNVTRENPARKVYTLLAEQLEAYGAQDGLRLAYMLSGMTRGCVEMWLAGDGELDAKRAYESFVKMIS